VRAIDLLDGLKANYNQALHPTETQEKDMLRVLRNIGYSEPQLDLIYDELLRTCEYFPKIFDIHNAGSTLRLARPARVDNESTNNYGWLSFRVRNLSYMVRVQCVDGEWVNARMGYANAGNIRVDLQKNPGRVPRLPPDATNVLISPDFPARLEKHEMPANVEEIRQIMSLFAKPEKKKPENHKSEFSSFLSEAIPEEDFPSVEFSQDVEVEYVDEPYGFEDL
jgi:hypothetical protein